MILGYSKVQSCADGHIKRMSVSACFTLKCLLNQFIILCVCVCVSPFLFAETS